MAKCDICGKGTVFGRNVSHSKRSTSRKVQPNVQRVTLRVGGVARRANICTRCLRTQAKQAVS
ncbi:MAG: 50S ribosomal protein L28 [Chloroflexi bacterium]|nr:50S ribosomal protein L28 [Chloroflexota bacterium]